MSRNRAHTRQQRAKAICRKQRTSFSLFGGDFFTLNGCYSKNQIRLWHCKRDRVVRPLDKREQISMIKMTEQIFELESKYRD